jgi:hypothetical protein
MSKLKIVRFKPASKIIREEWARRRNRVPELGERHIVCNWVREEEPVSAPFIDEHWLAQLHELLPDKIVSNLQRARDAREGRIPLIKAGLGYEELLSSAIVDGSALASSSTEANLFPNLLLPANYLQPGGIPGRSLRTQARGRHTTLTTAATLTFSLGSALTNVTIPTTRWASSGAITMDTAAQTATMWEVEMHSVVRSVGGSGTVFCMGDAASAAMALTIANAQAVFLGSAGSATPAAATVDMTVPEFKIFTAKWSLATAYSIQGHQYLVESLN